MTLTSFRFTLCCPLCSRPDLLKGHAKAAYDIHARDWRIEDVEGRISCECGYFWNKEVKSDPWNFQIAFDPLITDADPHRPDLYWESGYYYVDRFTDGSFSSFRQTMDTGRKATISPHQDKILDCTYRVFIDAGYALAQIVMRGGARTTMASWVDHQKQADKDARAAHAPGIDWDGDEYGDDHNESLAEQGETE